MQWEGTWGPHAARNPGLYTGSSSNAGPSNYTRLYTVQVADMFPTLALASKPRAHEGTAASIKITHRLELLQAGFQIWACHLPHLSWSLQLLGAHHHSTQGGKGQVREGVEHDQLHTSINTCKRFGQGTSAVCKKGKRPQHTTGSGIAGHAACMHDAKLTTKQAHYCLLSSQLLSMVSCEY